jgi:hypothetical protein
MLLSQCHGPEEETDGVYKGVIGEMGNPSSEDKQSLGGSMGSFHPCLIRLDPLHPSLKPLLLFAVTPPPCSSAASGFLKTEEAQVGRRKGKCSCRDPDFESGIS